MIKIKHKKENTISKCYKYFEIFVVQQMNERKEQKKKKRKKKRKKQRIKRKRTNIYNPNREIVIIVII